ncbi:MAG: phosphoribosyltransferase family protein [Patescibacteria group bacterium]
MRLLKKARENKTRMTIKKFLLNLLFPVECLDCGQTGAWLCDRCFRRLTAETPTKNQRSESRTSNLKIPALNGIFIAGDYENPRLARLIRKFKYGFLSALGKILGQFLSHSWSGQLFLMPGLRVQEIWLIPIPLSKKRLRWRGFNQAEILAQAISRDFGYPLCLDLRRTRDTKPQADLSEKKRLANINGCFTWNGSDLNGRTLIIIDDVITTGATMNEAALCLKQAGAKEVYGLVLAKG